MVSASDTLLHASSVAIDGRAVLIAGLSGAGKSDLALRLIDRGATLVSDDYTALARSGAQLLASPPATIAGKLEVRGLGIIPVAHVAGVPVILFVQLADQVERMPEAATCSLAGVTVPQLLLDARPASAPIKVELALRAQMAGA